MSIHVLFYSIFAVMNKTRFWKWLKIGLLIYIVLGVSLYFLQDYFIFHPTRLPPDHKYAFEVPFSEIELSVADDRNLSIVRFETSDSVKKGVVLYFHGNMKNITRYAKFAESFTRNGYDVLMPDYPGFGKTTGKRKETIFYADALTLYTIAIRDFPAEKIIIYGKSIGTGIAAQLASIRDCKRLILETPYYNFPALCRKYFFIYPVSLGSKYSFPTSTFIKQIQVPITLLHGTSDGVIPYKHSTWLVEKKPGTGLITIKGGTHNDLPDYPVFQHSIDSLLSN